jgi:hypothetical protein
MDGHTGLSYKEAKRVRSSGFELVLSSLAESSGRTYFIIHATCNSYGSDLPPEIFLQSLGFTPFRGNCQFTDQACYWYRYADVVTSRYGQDFIKNTIAVERFDALAKDFSVLYDTVRQAHRMIRDVGLTAPVPKLPTDPLILTVDESEVPSWVESVKFPILTDLEDKAAILRAQILELREFLPLLYASGEVLEGAAISALKSLGLRAEKTTKGFTADILAEDSSAAYRFGIEVTGVSGSIGKDSKKLTQLLEFERIKENAENTVLLANTFRDLPVDERITRESFTKPVIDFLSRHPILIITTFDLYRLVGDVVAGRRVAVDVVKELFEIEGVYHYMQATE